MKMIQKIWINIVIKEWMKWLPDKTFLSIYYRIMTGKRLNLKNPTSFSEKLQWMKLYDRNSLYTVLADKYSVRDYVKELIGDKYLSSLYGVWETPDQIAYDELPSTFVLKTTHDSGGIVICNKNMKMDTDQINIFLQTHLNRNLFYRTREWTYLNIKPRIIAEEYLENTQINVSGIMKGILLDYKFYCFNGEPKFLYVGYSNMKNGQKHDQLTFFDLEWNKTVFYRSDHEPLPFEIKKPENLEEMITIAKKLSTNIPFVRVDLYNIKGRIVFSEMTFYPGGGFARFEPDHWEYKIGEWIDLPR